MNCSISFASGVRKFYFLIIFCVVESVPIQAQKPACIDVTLSTPGIQQRRITYKIIDAPDKTFCYDIFMNGRLLIHQPSVPGLQGRQGFVLKSDAEKVAALVIKKIANGIMPPTIEPRELDSLSIRFKTR